MTSASSLKRAQVVLCHAAPTRLRLDPRCLAAHVRIVWEPRSVNAHHALTTAMDGRCSGSGQRMPGLLHCCPDVKRRAAGSRSWSGPPSSRSTWRRPPPTGGRREVQLTCGCWLRPRRMASWRERLRPNILNCSITERPLCGGNSLASYMHESTTAGRKGQVATKALCLWSRGVC